MLISFQEKEIRLPDFMIIGAARSGTTTLYHSLRQHPEIFLGKKEPFFFSFMNCRPGYEDPAFRNEVVWRFEDYARLFQDATPAQLIGEASASYLYTYEATLRHIKTVYGTHSNRLRIIAILRNPVDRAFSHHLFAVRNGIEELSFEEAIAEDNIAARIKKSWDYDYIEFGKYYKQIKAYKYSFPLMRIYLYEDLHNIRKLLRDIFGFLGVDANVQVDSRIVANPAGSPRVRSLVNFFLNDNVFKKANRCLVPKQYQLKVLSINEKLLRSCLTRPLMRHETRVRLVELFQDNILRLQDVINRDLSEWLKV